jgi:hypothetical protein
VTAVERGCGTAVATGAGVTILPQPSIALSGLHEEVRRQFPEESVTTRPVTDEPTKASFALSLAGAGTATARPVAARVKAVSFM